MTETAELAAALAAVQAELPDVKKNRSADVKNKEGKYLYSYSYADLADVSTAALPVLGRHGLAFASFPGHQPDGKFGLRYYLLHSSGQSIEGFFEIDDKGGMQLVGGRITYARRYCLCAVIGITAEEDVDAREDERSRTAQRKPRASSPVPAQTATRTRPAARSAPQTGTGGDLPPLPEEEEPPGPRVATASQSLIGLIQHELERLDMGGDSKEQRQARLRVVSRLARRAVPLTTSKELQAAEARDVLAKLKDCAEPVDLDGLLAEYASEGGPREEDTEVPGE